MKANRLVILLAIMLTFAVLRFAFPPREKEYATAEPVVRRQEPRVHATQSRPAQVAKSEQTSPNEEDVPGNAFAVRVVAAPSPAPPPVAMIAPVVAAPPVQLPSSPDTTAPPPVPLQVIGTYDDGGAPAVFVATAIGTLIARPGTVLLAEYRVTGITPQQVSLIQVSTQRTIQLPVPGGVAR